MVMKNDYWKSVTGKRIIFFLLIFFVVIGSVEIPNSIS